jgi:hypothetical protein
MAEKILGLLSAFVLGIVAGFFVFVWAIKNTIRYAPELRRQLREYIDRHEPRLVALGDFPSTIQQPHGIPIEIGMRAVSGRCIQCGSPEDVRPEGDVLFPQPLCRPCAGKFWGIQ